MNIAVASNPMSLIVKGAVITGGAMAAGALFTPSILPVGAAFGVGLVSGGVLGAVDALLRPANDYPCATLGFCDGALLGTFGAAVMSALGFVRPLTAGMVCKLALGAIGGAVCVTVGLALILGVAHCIAPSYELL